MRCAHWDHGTCRSCTHLPTPYAQQITAKHARVADTLAAHAAPEAWLPDATSPEAGFRTKAKLVVGGTWKRPTFGILDANRRGVDLAGCPIQHPAINATIPALRTLVTGLRIAPYDVPGRRGELKYVLLTVGDDDQLMIRFVLRSARHVPDLRRALPHLRHLIPAARVVTANIHPTHEAIVEGDEEIVLTRETTLPMTVGDVRLHLGPRSFSQTNTRVAGELYRQVAQWATLPLIAEGGAAGGAGAPGSNAGTTGLMAEARAGGCGGDMAEGAAPADAHGRPNRADGAPRADARTQGRGRASDSSAGESGRTPETLWDLYCGVGGFALHAARAGITHVTGVEISDAAIDAATRGARELGEDVAARARFHAGDATEWAVRGAGARAHDSTDTRPTTRPTAGDGASQPSGRLGTGESGAPADVIVVNPPRRGIGAELAEWLDGCGAPRVIYSSCNPVSLARDLDAMPHLRVRAARLFDMFPHTDHAEVAVLLERH